MNWTLQKRILVPTAALTVFVTAAITATSFFMARSSLETLLDEQLRDLCTASVQQVESWIEGQQQNISHWGSQAHVEHALQDSAEGSAASGRLSQELARAKASYGFFEDIHLADLRGNTRASSNPESVNKLVVTDRQYFKDAAAGKTVVSDVLKSRTTGNPIVVIAVPVLREKEIRGVLYGVLDLNWFSNRFVGKIKILKTGYVFLVDDAGVFVAHPDKARILQTKLADFDWGKSMQASDRGHLDYTFGAEDKTATFEKSAMLGWRAIATVPMAELNAPAYEIGRVNLILGLVSLVVGLAAMFVTARSISRPVKQVADQLAASAQHTTGAAGQMSDASQSLAEGSSEQASSLEETSSSLEEMSSMTKRNAENATKANELARVARQAADTGAEDMKAMNTAMSDIKVSSDDIAKIIKTIDEIAFQTNILALNAAVEAARAGESGAGFAVVAEEVRSLAQRSANAAKETAAKIESAIGKTTQGVEISAKVAHSLNEIVEKVRQVDALVTEVAGASREQSQGVEQINSAVRQMDKVVQSNAAAAEESASAAAELNAQAAALNDAVASLNRLVGGVNQNGRVAPAGTAINLDDARPTPVSPVRRAPAMHAAPVSERKLRPAARTEADLSFADEDTTPASVPANGVHADRFFRR